MACERPPPAGPTNFREMFYYTWTWLNNLYDCIGEGGDCYCFDLTPNDCACDAIDQVVAKYANQFVGIVRGYGSSYTPDPLSPGNGDFENISGLPFDESDRVYRADFRANDTSLVGDTEYDLLALCAPGETIFRTTAITISNSSRLDMQSLEWDALAADLSGGGTKREYAIDIYNASAWGAIYYPYYADQNDPLNGLWVLGHGSDHFGASGGLFKYQWAIALDPATGRVRAYSDGGGSGTRDWFWDSQNAGPNGGGGGNDPRLIFYDGAGEREYGVLFVKQRLSKFALSIEVWRDGAKIYDIDITRNNNGDTIASEDEYTFAWSGTDTLISTGDFRASFGRSQNDNGRNVFPWMFHASANIDIAGISLDLLDALQRNFNTCVPSESATLLPGQVLKYSGNVGGKDQFAPGFVHPPPPDPLNLENVQLMPDLSGVQDEVRWGPRDSRTIITPTNVEPDALPGDLWLFSDPVVSQCHFDEANGATQIVDEVAARQWNANSGSAVTSNVNPEYGVGSFHAPADGDYVVHPADEDLRLSGDFCLEISVWVSSFADHCGIYHSGLLNDNDNRFQIWVNTAGNLKALCVDGGVTRLDLEATATFPTSQWVKVCLEKDGDTVTLYTDGVADDSDTMTGEWEGTANARIAVARASSATQSLEGYCDEFRLTKAVRYGAGYTPATAAFPAPGNDDALRIKRQNGTWAVITLG